MRHDINCTCASHKLSFLRSFRDTGAPAAAILCAVCLWGGSFAAMRIVLRTLNRMAIPLVVLLPLAGVLRNCDYRAGDWKLLIPMVLFQPCLYFSLESNALKLTTSSQAGVIAASVPLLVAIGAYLLLAEPLSRKSIAGLMLSIPGVAALTLLQGDRGDAPNPYLGNALEVGAMICAAANMLIIKKLSSRYSAWTLTALQVVAGAFFFLPGVWFLFQPHAARFNPQLIWTLLFLGIFVTLGAFGLYNWGICRIPASKASIFINLVPVIAVLIGWLVLGEQLTIFQWVAALGVISGVWISQKA